MPDDISYIPSGCFSEATLKTIKLPKKLEVIGNGAFSGTAIRKITLPKNLKEIGYEAFRFSKLKTIKIPDSVEKISGYAFDGVNFKDAITLPKSIKHLEEFTFNSGTKVIADSLTGIPGAVGHIQNTIWDKMNIDFSLNKTNVILLPKSQYA